VTGLLPWQRTVFPFNLHLKMRVHPSSKHTVYLMHKTSTSAAVEFMPIGRMRVIAHTAAE
jgi:hypothetical protein